MEQRLLNTAPLVHVARKALRSDRCPRCQERRDVCAGNTWVSMGVRDAVPLSECVAKERQNWTTLWVSKIVVRGVAPLTFTTAS